MIKIMKYKLSIILLLLVGCIIKSCTGMDEEYKEFLKPETIYVGTADSLKIFPGNGRLIINFELTDPSITKTVFYWNNKSDSMEMDISMEKTKEIINTKIENLTEGTYSFNVITYDSKGNSSITKTVVGRVYGDKYASSLLDTPIKGAYVNDKDPTKVDINWGNPDDSAIGMEIFYTNSSDEEVFLYCPVQYKDTILVDRKESTNLRYRTLFLPEENAIDTFYTEFKPSRIKGSAVEYDRSKWTATGEYDKGNPRPPQNLFDGKVGTVWHMDKNLKYPHKASIDLKQLNIISGFYFYQREPLDGAVNLIEIKTSSDGNTWKTLGEFNLANKLGKQYLELNDDVECQYIELIIKSDYKGGSATALGEMGAYRR